MKNIILIKLGGSVVTDKNTSYKARTKIIDRLIDELKPIKYVFILAHGSGSFGHTSAVKFGGKKGYRSIYGITKVMHDAMEINQIIMKRLILKKVPVVSIRPLSLIVTKEGKQSENNFRLIEEALDQDLIPVVFGDVIFDKSWKTTIYSGERTLNQIAIYLLNKGYKINKFIQVGETFGFYDYRKHTIPIINKKSWSRYKKYVKKTGRNDVTGEIGHKIEDALEMTKFGIKTILINGNKPKQLRRALLGKSVKGTIIE